MACSVVQTEQAHAHHTGHPGPPRPPAAPGARRRAPAGRRPPSTQEAACADAHVDMMAKYDAKNPTALKQLVGAGTQLRQFPKPVMDACYKAAQEVFAEIAAKNADFKKTIDAMQAYRSDQYLWWQVAEYTYDTFMIRGSRRRVYDAYELGEHQALYLRIISPISRAQLLARLPAGTAVEAREHFEAGYEFLVRGLPSVFFPFIEAEVLNPLSREPHVGNDHDNVVLSAIGIDQKSGIYVRDFRTGMVKMVRGETSYLVDPRGEEHVHRSVPHDRWNLWIGHAEPHKVTTAAVSTPKSSAIIAIRT